MAVNTYNKILLSGTQAEYNALKAATPSQLDSTKLYFCTDSGKLYKGEVDFTNNIVKLTNKEGLTPLPGKIYIFSGLGTVETYVGTGWEVIKNELVTSMTAQSTDAQVPSAKAVYDAIQAASTGSNLVASIAPAVDGSDASIPATFTYTMADGTTTHDVEIQGVSLKPTWNSTTRVLTIPVTGEQNPVEVNIGKDIFIDPTANNRYENGNIYLYLNDGTQSSNPTELVIPVYSLVTDYVGGDTNTINVSVDSTTHIITASAIVRPDVATPGSEFTNALKVSTTTGAKGLYVDLSGYTPTADLDTFITNSTQVTENTTNIANITNNWGWGTIPAPTNAE